MKMKDLGMAEQAFTMVLKGLKSYHNAGYLRYADMAKGIFESPQAQQSEVSPLNRFGFVSKGGANMVCQHHQVSQPRQVEEFSRRGLEGYQPRKRWEEQWEQLKVSRKAGKKGGTQPLISAITGMMMTRVEPQHGNTRGHKMENMHQKRTNNKESKQKWLMTN